MKRFGFLVTAVLLIFTIFAVSTFADEKTTVKVWAPAGQGKWLISSSVPAEFEKVYPQYKVEVTQYSFDNLHDKLIAGFTGGELPDIAMLGDQTVMEFAALDALEPLDDFKKANGYKDSDFMPGSWSHFIVPDGTLYAAPAYSEYRVLFYRTDLFKKAGISKPPATFDELVKVAMKLTNGKTQFGLAHQTGQLDFHFFSWLLYAKGGNFYTSDYKKCTLTEPAAIEALEFYKSLYDKNIIPNDPAKQADTFKGFISGYYAMAESGPWWLGLLAQQPEMKGKWATAPLPGDKTKISYGHPNAWMIPKNAKNKAGAKAWLQFFLKDKPQVEFFKGNGNFPVLRSAFDDPILKNDPAIPAFLKAAENGFDSLHNIPNGKPVTEVVIKMLSDIRINKVTPKEGAAEASNRINSLIR